MKRGPIRVADSEILDYVFEMSEGHVLDFSNSSFSEFFSGELGVDIDSSMYCDVGTGKAKRLKSYLKKSSNDDVLRVLSALWEYREAKRTRAGIEDKNPGYIAEYWQLIARLGGRLPGKSKKRPASISDEKLSKQIADDLLNKLIEITNLQPQQRGYAFEKFLKELFDVSGLAGRASFRVTGEQIDGSFEMNGETYLLEAKWTDHQVDASGLRSFNAKVQDKAAWSRGLFISNSGFTEEGLIAFGKGNSLVCMDGLDLSEVLRGSMSFQMALSKKVRRAAETGRPFIRLRDLV